MARVASGRLTSILMIPICNCIPHVLRYVFMTQPLGHGIFAGTTTTGERDLSQPTEPRRSRYSSTDGLFDTICQSTRKLVISIFWRLMQSELRHKVDESRQATEYIRNACEIEPSPKQLRSRRWRQVPQAPGSRAFPETKNSEIPVVLERAGGLTF